MQAPQHPHLIITTLRKRADFLRLNRGQKYITDSFILRALPQAVPLSPAQCRVGYTVTTKCGNAVVRNRIKRRLRSLVRELLPDLGKAQVDYVFIARADAPLPAADCAMDDLRAQFSKAVQAVHRRLK